MSGQFGVFNPLQKWKNGDFPCDANVKIALNQWSQEDDIISISASLASDSEIDFAIDQLKKDLELVRRKAKQVLKSQRDKIQSPIGN